MWKDNNLQHFSFQICKRHKTEFNDIYSEICSNFNLNAQISGSRYNSLQSERHDVVLRWVTLRSRTVLDLPARPVHPSHHAPHGVPPQDGDVQLLSSISVLGGLAVVVSRALVGGQSIVQHSQVPPKARISSNNDYLRHSGFGPRGQICIAKAIFHRLIAQKWGKSLLLKGSFFSLTHG